MAMAVQNFVLMFGGAYIIVHRSVLVKTDVWRQAMEVKMMDFRKQVKYRLIDLGKSQKWLEEAVSKKTGLFVDASYLNKIYNGQRNPTKIVDAICEILDIQKGE